MAVLIKLQPDDESVYVCNEDKDKNWFLLEKIRFKDEDGCTRFNLYYAPLSLPQENIMGPRGASNCCIFNRRPTECCCGQILHGVVRYFYRCKKARADHTVDCNTVLRRNLKKSVGLMVLDLVSTVLEI